MGESRCWLERIECWSRFDGRGSKPLGRCPRSQRPALAEHGMQSGSGRRHNPGPEHASGCRVTWVADGADLLESTQSPVLVDDTVPNHLVWVCWNTIDVWSMACSRIGSWTKKWVRRLAVRRGGESSGVDVTRSDKEITVFCNAAWFQRSTIHGRPVRCRPLRAGRRMSVVADFFASRAAHAVVVDTPGDELLILCFLRMLFGARNCKLVAVDLILSRPAGIRQQVRAFVTRRLLTSVDLFIFYFRDIDGLVQEFGIAPEKTVSIPFKVNNYETITRTPVSDEGFVLSCGRSMRDYSTFCRAMEELPYRAYILAPVDAVLRRHGTTAAGSDPPDNVSIVVDDGSMESWVKWMARARLVVLPVLPGTLVASGISTYLGAMALGKCVIISESPATRGLLTSDQAIIVPAADPGALRAAVKHAYEDDGTRERIAANGYAYAQSLGDESRLARDIVREVAKVIARSEV